MTYGIIAAIAAAATWAFSSTLMATQISRVDSFTVSALRLVWASAFFVVALFAFGVQGDITEMSNAQLLGLAGSALVGLGAGDTIYVASISRLGMARAFTISLGLFTVFTYALAIAVLGEEVTIAVAVGSVLVMAGVYIVSLYGRAKPVLAASDIPLPASRLVRGLVMVVLAAVFWALATVWLRAVGDDHHAVAVGAVRIPAAAVILAGIVSLQANSTIRRRAVSRRSMVVLAAAGVGGTGLGSLLYIYAIQEAGAGLTVVLSSLSPLFALPLGAVFLGEAITRWVAAGSVVACAGILILSI